MQNEHIPSKNNFYFQVRSDIYHNNSTLLTLISSHQNTIIKNICLQLLTYSEQNDPILFLRTISQLKSIHYISIKHHQIIASAILNLLFKQKDNNPTLELFHVLFNHIKYLSRFSSDSFTIDWKLFYYYYLFYKKQFHENQIVIRLFNILPKFYGNQYNENDYNFIKDKALEHFSNQNARILNYEEGIKLLKYFVPRTYLRKDKEIQEILCDIVVSNNNLFDSVCDIFKKIMYQHNKDYTQILNKSNYIIIDKVKFIRMFFNAFSLMLSKELSNLECKDNINTLIVNLQHEHQEEIQFGKLFYKSNVYAVLALLLFDNEFVEHRDLIDSLFERVLNEIQMNIINIKKGRKKMLEYMNKTLYYIYSYIFCSKIYNTNSHSRNITQKEYEKHSELYNRFNLLFNNYLHNYLLTEAKISDEEIIEKYSLYYAMLIMRYNKNCPNYSSFFTEIENLLISFKKNSDKCLFRYYRVYNIILIYYLSENIYFKNENNSIRELLSNSFCEFINDISSANPIANYKRFNIIKTYYIIFSNYKKKISSQNKILFGMLELLENKAIELFNKIIPILDIFTNNIPSFYSAVNSIYMLISENTKMKISNNINDFILNNEPDPKYFNHYFHIIYDSEKLFKTILEDLVYIDKENCFHLQKHCLYNEEIVKTIEITAYNQKKISYYVGIFNNIDFLFNKEKNSFNILKYKENIITALYGLFNQKNIKVFDIGFALLNGLFKLLNGYQFSAKIIYPSNEIISFILEIFNQIILPYQKWVETKLIENNNLNLNERIVYIYTHFIQTFCIQYNNIFLHVNSNKSDLYNQLTQCMVNNLNIIVRLIAFFPRQQENEIISNIIIDICYQIINTYITDLYSVSENNSKYSYIYQANKSILNIRKTLLNDWSFKQENKSISLLNKDCNYFKFFTKQNEEYILSALSRFDFSTVELTKKFTENYKNALNIESIDQFNAIVEKVETIYFNKLDQIKGETVSLIANLALDNISNNLFYLYKEKMSSQDFSKKPLDYCKIIEEYLKIIEVVNNKKYKDTQKLYKNFMDLIMFIYKRHYNSKVANVKNKKIKYSELMLSPIILNFNEKSQKLLTKVKELYHQKHTSINVENSLILFNNYITKLLTEYSSQMNKINNLENDFRGFFIMTIFCLFYESSKIELINQIEIMIYNKIINNEISPDIKLYWLRILFILLHKKHSSKKQFKSILFTTPEEYNAQYINLIRTLPLNQININDNPLKKLIYYDDKAIIPQKDINIDVNLFNKSLEIINEWSYEKYLSTKENNIQKYSKFKFKDRNQIKEFLDGFSFFKENIHLNILSTYINETLSRKNKFILRENAPFKPFISLIIYYFFTFGYFDENQFNVEQLILSCKLNCIPSIAHTFNILGGYLLYLVKIKGNVIKCQEIMNKVFIIINMHNSIKLIDDIYKALIAFLIRRFTIYENESVFISNFNNEKYLIFLNVQLLLHFQGYVKYILSSNRSNRERLILTNKELLNNIFNSNEKLIRYIDYIPDLIMYYCLLTEKRIYVTNKYRYENRDDFYLLFNDLISSQAFKTLNDANILELILSLLNTFKSFVLKPSLLCSYFITSIGNILDKEKNQEYVHKLQLALLNITYSRNEEMNYFEITNTLFNELNKLLNSNTSNEKSLIITLIQMYYQNNYLYGYPALKVTHNQQIIDLICQYLLKFKNCSAITEKIEGLINQLFTSMNDKETFDYIQVEIENKTQIKTAIMSYSVLKYTLSFPKYIQHIIIDLYKKIKRDDLEKEAKDIIKEVLKNVNGKYQESIYLLQEVVGKECKEVFKLLNSSKNYFT